MRRFLPVILALLAGVGLGAVAVEAIIGGGEEGPRLAPSRVTVDELPAGPAEVTVETLRLGSGFASRHRHGGPTVNLVRSGRVAIADEEGVRRYGPGDSFVEPGGHVHTIEVIAAARIDVIRLLPPGAQATTEVPGPAP